jgi:transcriptional regulator with XRE-family HTH domain
MDTKQFGIRLAQKRAVKNISAYALSLAIGKSPNYIHKAETAKINISIKSLFEICEALQITPRELFSDD